MEQIVIAALFIEPDGIYANAPGVDAWCEMRDARCEHMREKKLDELEAAIKELGAVLQKRVIKNSPSEKRGTKKT